MQPLFAPAKLNLFLAITGRRADGFHDLVSLVVPVSLADTLAVEPTSQAGFRLECDDPAVPLDDSNLVLQAARLFAEQTGWRGGAIFRLEKRIPMGAGLGGGSSNGVAALKALNSLAGEPLSPTALADLAARLGSDCPLFVHGRPLVMRGRGERVEVLPEAVAARLRGTRVLLFKPAFGIATAWAYRQLAELATGEGGTGGANVYLPSAEAERRVGAWIDDASAPVTTLLFNTLELPAFRKFVALPTLLDRLQTRHGLVARMTGSGSACFAILPPEFDPAPVISTIRECWGESAWVAEASMM